MSIVGNLRAAKDFITGGGAEISVRVQDSARREVPTLFEVSAEVKANPMAIQRVYLKLRATIHREFQRGLDGSPARMHDMKRDFEAELEHVEVQTLESGKCYRWTLEHVFPEAAKPTFADANTRHVWEMCAFLDKTGNDPDSGWIEFELE